MAVTITQEEMLEKAQTYLKVHYGEDTLRMDVLSNDVTDGSGKLVVECTVTTGAGRSDWRKTFTFRNGEVTNMSWRYLG